MNNQTFIQKNETKIDFIRAVFGAFFIAWLKWGNLV